MEVAAIGGLVASGVGAAAAVVQAVSQAKPVFWDPLVYKNALPDNIIGEHVEKKPGPDIRKFRTLRKPLEQILDLLTNNKVKLIGIQGTVGIGKTTVMLNLNNHERVSKMFDIVIWLTVSKEGSRENMSCEHLQKAIGQRLKLNMEGTSKAVSQRILTVLKGKKFLLLLDDVKKELNLREIGVPDCNKGSKVVLTTRFRNVCTCMVDKVIKVTYLSRDEAWKMFQDVLGRPEFIKNSKIGPLARQVCNECSGLPLLIEKVANTFKLKNNERLWLYGLNSWRKWPEKECEGIREVYKLLKFCYDELVDDQYKKCFLYGALYPEDSEINGDYLLECWAAEDLLGNDHGMTNVDEDRAMIGDDDRAMIGELILIHLKDVSLLDEGKKENHVRMHKFIRQVALYIAEDDPECRYLVETSKSLEVPPGEGSWSQKKRISLGDNKLIQLPESPNCTVLSTLFLQKNKDLQTIPDLFFKHMKNLRVLDLSDTGIRVLPSSISNLIDLNNLYLNDCKNLEELPSHIAQLRQLEALDIRGSGVNIIPPHFENLICLRRFRVTFTKSGTGTPAQEVLFNYNIISKLSKLEELVIDVKSPASLSSEVVENIMNEVATLQNLKTLKFCISNKVVDIIEVVEETSTKLRINVPEARNLVSFIQRSKWKDVPAIKSFQFFIGCQNSENTQNPDTVDFAKYVKYCYGAGSDPPILKVLAEANAFELVNHKDMKQLSDFGIITSMTNVQCCVIENCDAIETIMDTSAVLLNLEHLYMKNLPNLKSVWNRPAQRGSLTKLTKLVLSNCQILVKVFPPGVIQQLREIQHLRIEKCQEIVELVTESDAAGNLPVLPELKELIILDMTKLTRICAIESLEWPSLEKLEIFNCPGLHELPFNKDNVAELRSIEGELHWWEALTWYDDEVKEQLQELFTQITQ